MAQTQNMIDLLLTDHEEVKSLLAKVERSSGPAKKEAFEKLVWELVRHETAEEEVVYPALRRVADGDAVADARIKEEEKATKTLSELEKLDIASAEWDTKFSAFQADVLAHATAEEQEVFPRLRQNQDAGELDRMGKVLELAKKAAPTHPHPNVPGSATAQMAAGPLAAAVDHARDAIREAREKLAS